MDLMNLLKERGFEEFVAEKFLFDFIGDNEFDEEYQHCKDCKFQLAIDSEGTSFWILVERCKRCQ